MADIITLAEAQTALPGLTDEQAADLQALISAASGLIGDRYPRARALEAYDEVYDIGTARQIRLRQKPIATVDRIMVDSTVILSIQATDPALTRATATLVCQGESGAQTPVSIVLQGWRAGVPDPTQTLNVTTYPTAQALADRVNALPGWQASVPPGHESVAAADMEAIQGIFGCKSTPAQFRAYTRDLNDWTLKPETGQLVIFEWRQEAYRFPDRTWGTDPRNSRLRVLYSAGWVTVPPQVKRACVIIVKDLMEATAKAGRIVAEGDDDYSYRLAEDYSFPKAAQVLLSKYKDRSFA